jgi:hypothetical protein
LRQIQLCSDDRNADQRQRAEKQLEAYPQRHDVLSPASDRIGRITMKIPARPV